MENVNDNAFCEVSEIQIVYNPKVKPSQRPKITGSKDTFEILSRAWDADKLQLIEQFKVMLLNRANKVLGIVDISTGGITGTVVDPKIVFAVALKACATGIILAHNHPSGNLTPSQNDLNLTRKIKEGGKMLEIETTDHIILTSEGYYSFADDGLI